MLFKIMITFPAPCSSVPIISKFTVAIVHYLHRPHWHHPVLPSRPLGCLTATGGSSGLRRPLTTSSSPSADLLRRGPGPVIITVAVEKRSSSARPEPRLSPACFSASPRGALGLSLGLPLPPPYLCSSGEHCQVPLRRGKRCKSLIPKLISRQGTRSGQPSHSASAGPTFFLPKWALYPAGSLIRTLISKLNACF